MDPAAAAEQIPCTKHKNRYIQAGKEKDCTALANIALVVIAVSSNTLSRRQHLEIINSGFLVTHPFISVQEAQLSPRDRVMRRVS